MHTPEDDEWRERWRGRMPWILVLAVPMFVATISITAEIVARRYGFIAPHHRMFLFGFNAGLSGLAGGIGGLFESGTLLDRVRFGVTYAMGGFMIYCAPLAAFMVMLMVF